MACDPLRTSLAATAALALCTAVAAQNAPLQRVPLKPGLWSIQGTTLLDGKPMPGPGGAAGPGGPGGKPMPDVAAAIAKLPPEARKQAEAMLRERQVAPPAAGGGGLQTCVTQAMLDGDGPWKQQALPACTQEVTHRSAERIAWRGSCSQPKGTLEGEMRIASPTRYSSTVRVTTERAGQPHTMVMTSEATWLGADCKGVLPPVPPVPPR